MGKYGEPISHEFWGKALDRALRLARKRSLPAPLARWTRTRDRIQREIHGSFWHAGRRSFGPMPWTASTARGAPAPGIQRLRGYPTGVTTPW